MDAPAYPVLSLSMKHAKVSSEVLSFVSVKQLHECMLILSGEVETPPLLQQFTPPEADANRLKVLITGLTLSTVRQQTYQACNVCISN